MTIQVPRNEWEDTLRAFSREHRAWLAHLEGPRPAAPHDRRLAGVFPEHSGSRIVAIRVEFEAGANRELSVTIPNPVTLEVQSEDDGTTSGLHIEDASGRRTHVCFPATPAGVLHGIAPMEF